ncbi:hypothetical protein [Portibacter lacus]|uniref:Sugar transporter n=1 Tax=Portibacter lacus TaxID=1099794 RepID=A0AA37SKD6_9BACT|nr:hypothetical protein [Portibacter lacus]GLR16193.1 hypothetical protein GCM10007940_08080 [Portibacter lacus]
MNNPTRPNIVFWIIGAVALLWNLMGVMAFFTQAMNSDSYRASIPADQLAIIDALPLWYILVFAVAVFASALACIFLLVRRKLAVPLFLIGFIAVLIQSSYNLFYNAGRAFYAMPQYIMLVSLPIVSALLYWYARRCDQKGWLK